MRTTLDLPEQLLSEAMAASGAKTKTATIILALKDYITKSKVLQLKDFEGKIDLDLDLDQLRNRG